ncbi:MAG: NADH-quinone oxidoreductase subunit M, partial [Acidimicrobiales bacterium]
MEDILKHWGPSVAIFAPLIGAALMMVIPKAREEAHKVIALLTSLFVFLTLIGIARIFDYGDAGRLQLVQDKRWIEVINSRYILGIDGISLPL